MGTLDYDWLVVFLAVVSSGNVAVPIDRQAGDIAEKLCMAEVTAVYLDRTVKQQASFAEELTGKEVFGSGAAARRGWKVRREPGPAAELLWIPQREDEAVLIFTSGTTGKSKGVLLTHQNIIDNTKCGLYFLEDGLGEGDNTIPILPPTHMLELTVGIFDRILLRRGPLLWREPEVHRKTDAALPTAGAGDGANDCGESV